MESGDFDFDADTQKLYAGEVVGQPYTPLDRDRLRYLGGTTNHWQGSCRPFDDLDLADWPFGADELAPFYRQAHDICHFGSHSFEPLDWSTDEARPLDLGEGAGLQSGVFQYSAPTRFGTEYRGDLAAAPGLTGYLNANLVRIDTNDAGAVTSVAVACLNGRRGRARAASRTSDCCAMPIGCRSPG